MVVINFILITRSILRLDRFRKVVISNIWYEKQQYIFVLSLNLLTTKLFYLNCHPLEVVSHRRDPQLQVGKKYSNLGTLSSTILKSFLLKSSFISKVWSGQL